MTHEAVIDRAVADVWAALEPAADAYLQAERARQRRRRRRIAGVGVVTVLAGAGGVAAAANLLGEPAPPSVQAHLAAVDDGMPADLRLHPDATHARSVAVDGDAVLYLADLPGGGYCSEVAIQGRPGGAVCRTASQVDRSAFEATVPGTPEDRAAAVVVAGRMPEGADGVRLVLGGSSSVEVGLGQDGFFIVELDDAQSAAARTGLRLEATAGASVVRKLDLTTAFDAGPPVGEPITVEMVSGPNDLTLVTRFRGVVAAPGAVSVRLTYPDGSTADAPIGADQRFDLAVPSDRQDAFADRPGTVTARAADGTELASRSVASVAYWHRADRGG